MKYSLVREFKGTYDEAVTQITHSLREAGFGILTQIDIQKTLKEKLGVDFPKYQFLGTCSPQNAYGALEAEKEIGLLLPCNVAVYEDEGKVIIAVMKPTAALALSDNPSIEKIASEVEERLERALQAAVTKNYFR